MSIKRFIILAILLAPLVYAYRERPLFDVHKTKIYAQASNADEPVQEEQLSLPQWDGLEFIDWNIVTATRDKSKQSMVSFGIVKYIVVVDSDWAPQAFGLKKPDEKKTP